jgi:hypothetical protein
VEDFDVCVIESVVEMLRYRIFKIKSFKKEKVSFEDFLTMLGKQKS